MTLYEKLKLLEDALKFYADRFNYKPPSYASSLKEPMDLYALTPVAQDQGDMASHALDLLHKGIGNGPSDQSSSVLT